ncbi:MAG: hypothetical protein M1819_002441 [Sarea resinae]|nr:MAG: hypothetical protein M1819_002441 [Sarea resinae]
MSKSTEQSKCVWKYSGGYKVAGIISVTLKEWKSWPEDVRKGMASQLRKTKSGRETLFDKNLANKGKVPPTKDILSFFERLDPPFLRACWAVLRCVGYDQPNSDKLEEPSLEYNAKHEEQEAARGRRKAGKHKTSSDTDWDEDYQEGVLVKRVRIEVDDCASRDSPRKIRRNERSLGNVTAPSSLFS